MTENKIKTNTNPRQLARTLIDNMTKAKFEHFLRYYEDRDPLHPVEGDEGNSICLFGHFIEQAKMTTGLNIPEIQDVKLTLQQELEFYDECAKNMVEEIVAGNFNDFEEELSEYYSIHGCWITTAQALKAACQKELVDSNNELLQRMLNILS